MADQEGEAQEHTYFISLDGEYLIAHPGPVSGPERAQIREIRMILRDPAGVNNILFTDVLPAVPDPDAAYCLSDTVSTYQRYNTRLNPGVWEVLPLQAGDAYILEMLHKRGSVNRTVTALFDFIIAGLNTGLSSISAGAESVSLITLKDKIEFYQYLKRQYIQTSADSRRMLRTRRRVIGGVEER